MLRRIKTYLFCFFSVFVLMSFFCFGCNSNSNSQKKLNEKSVYNIENYIKLPKNFQKKYLIREVKIYKGLIDRDYKFASIKIAFTDSISKKKKEIINNMKQAIIDTYKTREAPYRIEVLAYNLSDDIEKDYTLGKATFEAKDEKQKLSEYKLKIETK